jgi:hypothetical protein
MISKRFQRSSFKLCIEISKELQNKLILKTISGLEESDDLNLLTLK